MFQHNMNLQNTSASENTFDIADVFLQTYKQYPNSPRREAGLLVHLSGLTIVKQYHTIAACLYLKIFNDKSKRESIKNDSGMPMTFLLIQVQSFARCCSLDNA